MFPDQGCYLLSLDSGRRPYFSSALAVAAATHAAAAAALAAAAELPGTRVSGAMESLFERDMIFI